MPEEITQQKALDTIVRAAMKREYDKGNQITNARAFAESVRNRALDNEAAIPGSLKLDYTASAKQLASDEPTRSMPEAYSPWSPPNDDYQPCTPEERARWLDLIQTKLAGLDLGFDTLTTETTPATVGAPLEDDDDIPGYGEPT